MSWPQSNSRKGLGLRAQQRANVLFNEWRFYNGRWQPSGARRELTKRLIASLREALDQWEAKL